jgi:AbrB family looped-hinge helix DNA binding protein
MITVTLSSKGQIVLPRGVRQALGLLQGDKLEISVEGQSVRLTPVPAETGGWERWQGRLAGSDALAELMAEHAAEVANERLP